MLGSKKLTGAIEPSCKDGLFDDGDNATHWCDINSYNRDILLDTIIENIFYLFYILLGNKKINWNSILPYLKVITFISFGQFKILFVQIYIFYWRWVSNIPVADFCPYSTSFTGPMAPTKQQKLQLFYVLLLSVVVVIPYIYSTMFPNL